MTPTSLPLLSFVIVCFNQEEYIDSALKSALEQTYSPLEIIISDDASTDDTFQIIQNTISRYKGPHQVITIRNNENLGIAKNVNLALKAANGELVILAAGDDISIPSRTSRIYRAYTESENRDILIHSNAIKIDSAGNILGIWRPPVISKNKSKIAIAISESIYIGATGALSRHLINKFGDIKYPHAYEDLVWGHRASIVKGLIYIPEALVEYRVGSGISTRKNPNGKISTVLKQHLKKRIMFIDVLKQRLDDLALVEHSGDTKYRQTIAKRLNIEMARAHLIELALTHRSLFPKSAPFKDYCLAAILELRDLIKNYLRLPMEKILSKRR